MANIYAVLFTFLGLVATYSSLVIWTALVLPAPVARARARLEAKPVGSFFAGLVFLLLTALAYVGFLAIRNPWMVFLTDLLDRGSDRLQFGRFYNDVVILANVVAWPLAAPAMLGWVIGGAGFAHIFAARARPLMHEDRPLAAVMLGVVLQAVACFLPAAGWFVFLPLMTVMSVGAGLLAVLRPGGLSATAGPSGSKTAAGRESRTYESELASS